MTSVTPGTAAKNDTKNDTMTFVTEQTGTLAVGDRAVAFASSAGEDTIAGLSVANSMGTGEGPSGSALGNENQPRFVGDAEKAFAPQTVELQVPSNGKSLLSQSLATLSGAISGGGVRLVSSALKPESHLGRRCHIARLAAKKWRTKLLSFSE